jgi:hypothetical protein
MGLNRNLGQLTEALTESSGNVLLNPNNVVGGTNVYIGQTMASDDWWRIYGNTPALDQGEMVFELGDNAIPHASNGQRFRFFYNNASGGAAKNPFILDYNDAIFNTNASFTGNVGIGTTSPSGRLTIQRASSGAETDIDFLNEIGSGGARAKIRFGGTNEELGFWVGSPATERMRITSGGNVLIGSQSAISTRQELRIGGNAAGSRISMGLNGTNYSSIVTDSGGNVYIVNEYPDSAIKLLMINFNNGVYLSQSATSWTANSDERLKNINGNIENAVDKLMTLSTVNFSWKNDENQKENLGLIAQDVEKVFPQVIDSNTLTNLDDSDDFDKTEYLGVRYQELVPVLIKAIQELKAEIEILKQNK